MLYLWGLDALGWANPYYASAAQAGSQSWAAFFFGSSDAGNGITVDKPPASLWGHAARPAAHTRRVRDRARARTGEHEVGRPGGCGVGFRLFDTELLVLAQRAGLRIHEVPVDWIDDPDSRVDIVSTAIADLKGIGRLAWAVVRQQLVRFAVVGAGSTLAYLVLYLLIRGLVSAQVANLIALLTTAIDNTVANRRWTFGVTGRRHVGRHQAQGLIIFGIGARRGEPDRDGRTVPAAPLLGVRHRSTGSAEQLALRPGHVDDRAEQYAVADSGAVRYQFRQRSGSET